MGLFDRLFKTDKEIKIKDDFEENYDNKIKCLYCETLISKDVKYCWKCGNQINRVTESVLERTDDEKTEKKTIKEEFTEYKYPDIDLIKDEDLRTAIKNVPDSGVINFPLGIDKDGRWVYYDITQMPNLLIGGTVMSGKTNMINLILMGLISKYSNKEVRIILADSKGVDYLCYKNEPHLLTPVINDAQRLVSILRLETNEMKNRYSELKKCGEKNICNYNKNIENKMPYHLIFIDDYTSFVNCNIDELNLCIEELAKSGWNVGIHLIIVANHPTTAILPSISKLNFPTRISFRVPSVKDSRMILETPGAEKISGIGNALINSNSISEVRQIHINMVEDSDIIAIVEDLSSKNEMHYNFEKNKPLIENEEYDDPMYNEVVEFAIQTGKISASLLQRKFRLGYNRAARIVDLLEERGVIGPQNGSKPREVLIKYER